MASPAAGFAIQARSHPPPDGARPKSREQARKTTADNEDAMHGSHPHRGFGVLGMTTLMVVLNLCGMFPGYASFGWVADHLGRRKAFLVYSLAAAVLIPIYAAARSQAVLLVVGTLVAFFGTGIFSGSGIMGSEIFPTAVRARGQEAIHRGHSAGRLYRLKEK